MAPISASYIDGPQHGEARYRIGDAASFSPADKLNKGPELRFENVVFAEVDEVKPIDCRPPNESHLP